MLTFSAVVESNFSAIARRMAVSLCCPSSLPQTMVMFSGMTPSVWSAELMIGRAMFPAPIMRILGDCIFLISFWDCLSF